MRGYTEKIRIELKHMDWITNDMSIEVAPRTSMSRIGIGDVVKGHDVVWLDDKSEKRLMSASYFQGDFQHPMGSYIIRTAKGKLPHFQIINWYAIDMKFFDKKTGVLMLCKHPESIASSDNITDSYTSYEDAYIAFNRNESISKILE